MPNESATSPPISEVEFERSLVILGANGTGKSRLGYWLEERNHWLTDKPYILRRISAQRNLQFEASASRLDRERARNRLAWGSDHHSGPSRVRGDPVVGVLNDYRFLIEVLFAEQDAQALAYMRAAADKSQELVRPNTTLLDQVKEIWHILFPQRELILEDYSVTAKPTDGGLEYPATQLSDGERVGLYLIGHTLLVPENAILLIDEPELHLHESIQATLWSTLESARPDCGFVYITHDLGFAASRIASPKIVLNSYKQGPPPSWEWQFAPEDTGLPEDVVLRIAGSRRPTLFVEGTVGSIDHELYSAAYPDHYIVPSESCEGVIRSVQVFNSQPGLHRYSVAGIVDRDDRDQGEIDRLAGQGIYVLPYAQAENVLVVEEVIKAVAAHLQYSVSEITDRLAEAKRKAMALLRRERDSTVAQRALYAVERRLAVIKPTGNSETDLVLAVSATAAAADASGAYKAAEAEIDSAIASGLLDSVLSVLRNKGILPEIASALGIRAQAYRRIAIALIRDSEQLRDSLAGVLPKL